MLDALVERALTTRFFFLLALVALLFGSALMMTDVKWVNASDSAPLGVDVTALAPGLSAEDVEQWVSVPIETALAAIPETLTVRSLSSAGVSRVTVVFSHSVTPARAYTTVERRLQSADLLSPEGVVQMDIDVSSAAADELMRYILIGDTAGHDASSLRRLDDRIVQPSLRSVPGVKAIRSFGGTVQSYQIRVDPGRLLAYQLTLDDIVTAVEASQGHADGGQIERGAERLVVRGVSLLPGGQEGLSQLELIPLKTLDDSIVRVGDVAAVELAPEPRRSAVSLSRQLPDGRVEQIEELVSGIVFKQPHADPATTAEAIRTRMAAIEKALPDGVRLAVEYNGAAADYEQVRRLLPAAGSAVLLIGVTLALALMNIRATVFALLSLALTLILALAALTVVGMPVNAMALAGLLAGVGVLAFTGPIAVIARLRPLPDPARGPGKPSDSGASRSLEAGSTPPWIAPLKAAIRSQGFTAIIAIITFLPMLWLAGNANRLLEPFAAGLIAAVLASLVLAILGLPALAPYLFAGPTGVTGSRLFVPLQSLYRRIMTRLLPKGRTVLLAAIAVFVLAASSIPLLGTGWTPSQDRQRLLIDVVLPVSARLDTARLLALKLEQQLLTFPEVNYAISRVGQLEESPLAYAPVGIEMMIGLRPADEWVSARSRDALLHTIAHKLNQHPGLTFRFSDPMLRRFNELGSAPKTQLEITVSGPDLDQLRDTAAAIERAIRELPGVRDVAVQSPRPAFEIVIEPQTEALARYGLSASDVMELINVGIAGATAGRIGSGHDGRAIVVRLDDNARNSLDAIRSLRLRSTNGQWIRLDHLASVQMTAGRPPIRHDDLRRSVVIEANTDRRPIGPIAAAIERRIRERVNLADGYDIALDGHHQFAQRALGELAGIVALTLLLLLWALAWVFAGSKALFIVGATLPIAISGAVFALYLTGQPVSAPGVVGFLVVLLLTMLIASTVIEAIDDRMQPGISRAQSALEATAAFLGPSLFMAVTLLLSLAPLYWAANGMFLHPLAAVVIGGTIPAALITLFVVPCAFVLGSATQKPSSTLRAAGG